MKTNRTPLLAMIALSTVLAAPLAFAQVDTTAAPTTDAQAIMQAQEAEIEAAPRAAGDAEQATPVEGAATADTTISSEAAATGTSMQGVQLGTDTAGQQGWEQLDSDRDGSISRQEAAANQGLARIFDDADTDADGVLTAEEYRSFVDRNYQPPPSD